jgi:hypothetical protein
LVIKRDFPLSKQEQNDIKQFGWFNDLQFCITTLFMDWPRGFRELMRKHKVHRPPDWIKYREAFLASNHSKDLRRLISPFKLENDDLALIGSVLYPEFHQDFVMGTRIRPVLKVDVILHAKMYAKIMVASRSRDYRAIRICMKEIQKKVGV